MASARLPAASGHWLGLGVCLLAIAPPNAALAGNFINIDAGTTGSVSTLAITQDATAASNTISGAAGAAAPFTVAGSWSSIAINQGGAGNQLTGAIRTSGKLPAGNSFSARYTGGANHHSVNIGSINAPSSVAETISIANTGPVANTISEVLDSAGVLVNGLTIHGTGNSVTNTIAAAAGITLDQIIGDGAANGTASGNTVVNSAKGLTGTYAATLRVVGDGGSAGMNNAITDIASGSGAHSFSTNLNGGSKNAVYSLLSGGIGTTQQSAALTADSTTQAQYAVSSKAIGASSVNTMLAGVIGGIYVQQGADVSSGNVTLKVTGNGYALGTLTAQQAQLFGVDTTSLPTNFFGATGTNPGIAVIQSSSISSTNQLTATVKVLAAGYTATITSSTP